MNAKKTAQWTALLLVFALVAGFFAPASGQVANAQGSTSLENAAPLTKGKDVENSFDSPEQTQWYKITPENDEIQKDSHMEISLASEGSLNISAYSSIENAANDQTFDIYRGFTTPDEPVTLEMPHAWKGPYYIKVESLGEDPETEEPPAADEQEKVNYTIGYKGVKHPPATEQAGEECPVEMSAGQKKSGSALLTQLRQLRDGLLSQTDEGKSLSSLYYKTAPFLVGKMMLHKDLREDVYNHLVTLKPLFNELAENGAESTYVLSGKDQTAIQALYKIALDAAPEKYKKDIEKIGKQAGIKALKGKKLSDLLEKNNLVPESTKDVTSKLIVKMKDGYTSKSLNQKLQTYGIESTSRSAFQSQKKMNGNMYVVKVDGAKASGTYSATSTSAKTSAKAAAAALSKLPGVEFAEPVQRYHSLANDVEYPYQWSLKNKGEDGGIKGADVNYESMSKLVDPKANDTLIAVVDTGVDYTLADLSNKVRSDIGKNFVTPDAAPLDDMGHGTHVSGIIAAQADNGYSMTGIDQKAKILPVKVLDASGSGDTEQIAMGIMYAADKGAKVINLSLGGGYSRVLEYAMKYASDKGAAIVVATGNDGTSAVSYPGSSKYAIGVGATNKLDVVADYSNYGSGLDLVAPGSNIPSLVPNGNVTLMSGTSMATPHVAAVAGLLLSENPRLKAKDVERILTQTADDIAFGEVDKSGDEYEEPTKPVPGYDTASGHGRLNAFKALSAVELNAKVDPVLDNMNKVSGVASIGSKVTVKNGSKTLGKATVSKTGTFAVNVPVQKANQVLHVEMAKGVANTALKAVVKKAPAPEMPKVSKVTAMSVAVKGNSVADGTIKVKDKKKKVISTAKVSSKGTFSAKIKKQKKGTILYVTVTDLAKRESKATKVIVN
ncbi:cell wall-associated protease [Fictibacillus enclensis]|uniref:Peptidase S8 n=1 Tax=Fictibacillus enclensis TaxID=1017270 RepID=A0A0V8J461_9BACL|nr:S8 family peptidase [Fictibacillus enclensis]KSU81954.1 peptidase S8 [Fictibacillus enclensis]SCC28318.1 cell wall-associated protease [Fictibacillus enclensis]